MPFTRPPAAECTAITEHMDELVKDGQIQSLAVAAYRWDGGITTAYYIGNALYPLLGAVAAVDTRLRLELTTR